MSDAARTVEQIITSVDAQLAKWRLWFPDEMSRVEIPRRDLLTLVEAARGAAELKAAKVAAQEEVKELQAALQSVVEAAEDADLSGWVSQRASIAAMRHAVAVRKAAALLAASPPADDPDAVPLGRMPPKGEGSDPATGLWPQSPASDEQEAA